MESCPDLGAYMYLDNVTRPVSELLGCSLVNLSSFVQGCQLELDPLRQGVGDWLWFSHQSSYCPPVLCTASQEHLLQSYIGGFGWLCQLWLVEFSKVRGMSGQK